MSVLSPSSTAFSIRAGRGIWGQPVIGCGCAIVAIKGPSWSEVPSRTHSFEQHEGLSTFSAVALFSCLISNAVAQNIITPAENAALPDNESLAFNYTRDRYYGQTSASITPYNASIEPSGVDYYTAMLTPQFEDFQEKVGQYQLVVLEACTVYPADITEFYVFVNKVHLTGSPYQCQTRRAFKFFECREYSIIYSHENTDV
ncbi:hypothetical protein FISHEDRAFT_56239 [Fistulina hepatica ATCC 64428]|uniref:Uncharacterized protein n=1 Tax=Fistulina hepatica ATCC 64428 TaxID=1128425 RepID=A0A0D7AL20_9AGAR|nr:hypothetical protein FISHEDRAFT_56239 [Fistulina hepatica ATCC 64428]